MIKIAGSGFKSGSISQRQRSRGSGSGSPPKCHGSGTLVFSYGTVIFLLRLGPNFPAEQQAPDGQQRTGHRHLLLRKEAQLQGARGTVPVPARRNPGHLSKNS
jgi:hypothetical protein